MARRHRNPGSPRVAVLGDSPLGAAVGHCLGGVAWQIADLSALISARWDLLVIVGPLPEELADFIQRAGVAALYAAVDGREVRIGPLVLPKGRPCHACCAARLGAGDPAACTSSFDEAARRIAREAVRVLDDGAGSPLAGRVLVLDNDTESLHSIVPMPWCAVCGGANGLPARGDELFPARLSPSELRARLSGWLDPRTGIVSHLISSGADGVPGELPYCAVAISTPSFGYGKGLTETEAMIGAFAEAMEQYSAASIPPGSLCQAPFDSLDQPALDPRDLCLYDDSQYRRPGFSFRPFDPSLPISWTRGPGWTPATRYGFPPLPYT